MNLAQRWIPKLSLIIISLIIVIGPMTVLHQLDAVTDHHHAVDCSICHIVHDSLHSQTTPLATPISPLSIFTLPAIGRGFQQYLSPIARSPPIHNIDL
ncbi:hypothetical protein H744_2c3401 [Photobacterium gaetbulicola Gung47]|uniref:Uncharacterized protein n=1 Tax=Photobacterium gaetbulicola Gung47 TaxID=658445 RepID=A0A0C5WUC6_9GAMM|nr:hypothetical protein H744_2c3401 [Photobacterium gaetbulicola Gung47]